MVRHRRELSAEREAWSSDAACRSASIDGRTADRASRSAHGAGWFDVTVAWSADIEDRSAEDAARYDATRDRTDDPRDRSADVAGRLGDRGDWSAEVEER